MHPLIRIIQQKLLKRVPEIKSGYTVRISQKVKEGGKERIQNFEGLVIKVNHGEGPEKTFTVRKIVEGIGVEKIFPMYSPNITKIVVKKKAKIRRSKLYYMRKRFGKSARLSERHVTDEERAVEESKMDEYVQEAVKAEEKRKKEEEAQEQTEEKVESTEPAKPTLAEPAKSDIETSSSTPPTEEGNEKKPKEEKPVSTEAEPNGEKKTPAESGEQIEPAPEEAKEKLEKDKESES